MASTNTSIEEASWNTALANKSSLKWGKAAKARLAELAIADASLSPKDLAIRLHKERHTWVFSEAMVTAQLQELGRKGLLSGPHSTHLTDDDIKAVKEMSEAPVVPSKGAPLTFQEAKAHAALDAIKSLSAYALRKRVKKTAAAGITPLDGAPTVASLPPTPSAVLVATVGAVNGPVNGATGSTNLMPAGSAVRRLPSMSTHVPSVMFFHNYLFLTFVLPRGDQGYAVGHGWMANLRPVDCRTCLDLYRHPKFCPFVWRIVHRISIPH